MGTDKRREQRRRIFMVDHASRTSASRCPSAVHAESGHVVARRRIDRVQEDAGLEQFTEVTARHDRGTGLPHRRPEQGAGAARPGCTLKIRRSPTLSLLPERPVFAESISGDGFGVYPFPSFSLAESLHPDCNLQYNPSQCRPAKAGDRRGLSLPLAHRVSGSTTRRDAMSGSNTAWLQRLSPASNFRELAERPSRKTGAARTDFLAWTDSQGIRPAEPSRRISARRHEAVRGRGIRRRPVLADIGR